jgi:hypothetical protein
MCAAGTLMAAGGRRRLLMTVCLGAAVAAAACGAATRAAPRVAPEGSPAAVASDCEIGTAAFERRDFAAATAPGWPTMKSTGQTRWSTGLKPSCVSHQMRQSDRRWNQF